jgi:hypothetical protein
MPRVPRNSYDVSYIEILLRTRTPCRIFVPEFFLGRTLDGQKSVSNSRSIAASVRYRRRCQRLFHR